MTGTPTSIVYSWLPLPEPIALVDKALAAAESKTNEELSFYHSRAKEYVEEANNSGVSPSDLEDYLNNELPYEACVVLLDGETSNLQATMNALDLDPKHQELFDGLADKLYTTLFASR